MPLQIIFAGPIKTHEALEVPSINLASRVLANSGPIVEGMPTGDKRRFPNVYTCNTHDIAFKLPKL